MTSEIAKIRIKIGQLEIEYEGASIFLQDDLVRILERTIELQAAHRDVIPSADATPTPDPAGEAAHSDLQDSTNTIATHLGVKTAPDLVMAAAAHLGLVQKKQKFSRQEINDEMQGATTFYNQNMTKNLSQALSSLVKNKKLNLVSKDTYALSATEKNSLESKLAQQ